MEPIKGYVVLTNTLSGYELVWREGEGDQTMPQVFKTEKEAQLEMLDDLKRDISEFKEGSRQWDEIIWPVDEYEVAQIEITSDGKICVWEQGNVWPVIETTLQQWRDNL